MLRLIQEKKSLNVINDQIGAPTGADLIADVTSLILLSLRENRQVKELYHLVPQGETSWYEYATYILQNGLDEPGINDLIINPIQSKDYPTPASRPYNSRLDTSKLSKDFSLSLPSWENGVDRMLTNFLR
jgi:dTDP-4-dehydrorhamnose reductase